MIVLRRAQERRHELAGGQAIWHTFALERGGTDVLSAGFGALEGLSEACLVPGGDSSPCGPTDAELVTYVADGAVVRHEPPGRSRVVQCGEFGHLAFARGDQLSDANASLSIPARIFWLQFRSPAPGYSCPRENRRFTAAERNGNFRVVASPDGRQASLQMGQSVLVFSALLDRGHHVVHGLLEGRMAWLHIVGGTGVFGELVLSEGDGVGLANERAVAFTAEEPSELMLVDLPDQAFPLWSAAVEP